MIYKPFMTLHLGTTSGKRAIYTSSLSKISHTFILDVTPFFFYLFFFKLSLELILLHANIPQAIDKYTIQQRIPGEPELPQHTAN